MLLFMDGASHYATAQLAQKYTAVNTAFCSFDVVAEGRTDGCVKRTATSNQQACGFLTVTPLLTQAGSWAKSTRGYFGCALKVDVLSRSQGGLLLNSTTSASGVFLTVMSQSGYPTFMITLQPNGTFNAYRFGQLAPGAPFFLAGSIQALNDAEWAYVEVGWFLSRGSDGTITIKVNGNTVLAFTGRTCPNSTDNFPFGDVSTLWNSINVLGMASNPAPFLVARMGDVYLLDDVAPNGSFLGDIRVAYIKPDGVGAESGWTPSSGANWQCVDEVPPNSDTDYVTTTAVGTRDTYTFQDVLGDPLAIQVCNYARKTDASGAAVSVITRQGGVDYDGPSQGLGSTAYDYYLQPYDTNPATSAAWTKAQMDAGEWGPLKSG